MSNNPQDKRLQKALRLAGEKYEAFFTGIVFHAVANPAFDPRSTEDGLRVVETAKQMTDAMMNALYLPKAKEEE